MRVNKKYCVFIKICEKKLNDKWVLNCLNYVIVEKLIKIVCNFYKKIKFLKKN